MQRQIEGAEDKPCKLRVWRSCACGRGQTENQRLRLNACVSLISFGLAPTLWCNQHLKSLILSQWGWARKRDCGCTSFPFCALWLLKFQEALYLLCHCNCHGPGLAQGYHEALIRADDPGQRLTPGLSMTCMVDCFCEWSRRRTPKATHRYTPTSLGQLVEEHACA
jgi:hypothetical protein